MSRAWWVFLVVLAGFVLLVLLVLPLLRGGGSGNSHLLGLGMERSGIGLEGTTRGKSADRALGDARSAGMDGRELVGLRLLEPRTATFEVVNALTKAPVAAELLFGSGRMVRTDQFGFAGPLLVLSTDTVHVSAKGHLDATWNADVWRGETTIRVALAPEARISVKVVDQAGHSVPGAQLLAYSLENHPGLGEAQDPQWSAITDETGSAVVQCLLPAIVEARAGGMTGGATLRPGVEELLVMLDVKRIPLRIALVDGSPLPQMEIVRLSQLGARIPVSGNSDGREFIAGVPSGSILELLHPYATQLNLEVSGGTSMRQWHGVTRIFASEAANRLEVLIEGGGELLRVLDEEAGAYQGQLQADLYVKHPSRGWIRERTLFVGFVDGLLRTETHWIQAFAEAPQRFLVLLSDDYAPTKVTVDVLSTRSINGTPATVRLQPGTRKRIHLRDSDGAKWTGHVDLTLEPYSIRIAHRVLPARLENGIEVGLPAVGSLDIRDSADGAVLASVDLDREIDDELNLTLRESSASVLVRNVPKGVRPMLINRQFGHLVSESEYVDGNWHFGGLPPGLYWLDEEARARAALIAPRNLPGAISVQLARRESAVIDWPHPVSREEEYSGRVLAEGIERDELVIWPLYYGLSWEAGLPVHPLQIDRDGWWVSGPSIMPPLAIVAGRRTRTGDFAILGMSSDIRLLEVRCGSLEIALNVRWTGPRPARVGWSWPRQALADSVHWFQVPEVWMPWPAEGHARWRHVPVQVDSIWVEMADGERRVYAVSVGQGRVEHIEIE